MNLFGDKKFGFGCMRLPMLNGDVDTTEMNKMVDAFIESGFCYFDTAHGYLGGKSETALKKCLASRYPRDRFILTDKLTNSYFKCEADIRPLFKSQLAACGVDYFDFYLMHAQNAEAYEYFKKNHAYETAFALKAEGKIAHVGISFHDKATVLDRILSEYPSIEVVQIQFNYMDYDDPSVESGKCLEVCKKHGKPVIVMEPVKGGNLAKLPDDAAAALDALHGGSHASYALRYVAGFGGIEMILSGMSSLEQMLDNISFMSSCKPLDAAEADAVMRVKELFRAKKLIPCTACRYCTDGCPKHISIPDLFACFNAKMAFHDWNADYYYGEVHTKNGGKASDCIKCGSCEKACPQHLPIRILLEDVVKEFERNEQI